jgi:hypothetical protein
MTVAAITPTTSYIEDGSTTTFPVKFRYMAPQDLGATRQSTDGTLTTLQYGVDYSATPGPTDDGGTLTVTAAAPRGTILNIARFTTRAQQSQYVTADTFPASTVETDFDQDMMIEQEQDAQLTDFAGRAIMAPEGETLTGLPPASQRAGFFLGFDANGNPILLNDPGGGSDSGLRADLAAVTGAQLVGYTAAGGVPITRSVLDKLRDGRPVLTDYTVLPDPITPDGWYLDTTWVHNRLQWCCAVPNTISMAGDNNVQGSGMIFTGSTSAQTPNSGVGNLSDCDVIRIFFTINPDAGPGVQCHTFSSMLQVAHDVTGTNNEGAILIGTMRSIGPIGYGTACGIWGADLHVEQYPGVATGKMVGLEVGVHASHQQPFGDLNTQQNGIVVWSGPRDGATGVMAHTAITMTGASGWTDFLRALHTDQATEVFVVYNNGNIVTRAPTGDMLIEGVTNQPGTNATFMLGCYTAADQPVEVAIQATAAGAVLMGSTTNSDVALIQNDVTRLHFNALRTISMQPINRMTYTVATLPAGIDGDTAFVSDATTAVFNGAVVGGGSLKLPVFYAGGGWKMG